MAPGCFRDNGRPGWSFGFPLDCHRAKRGMDSLRCFVPGRSHNLAARSQSRTIRPGISPIFDHSPHGIFARTFADAIAVRGIDQRPAFRNVPSHRFLGPWRVFRANEDWQRERNSGSPSAFDVCRGRDLTFRQLQLESHPIVAPCVFRLHAHDRGRCFRLHWRRVDRFERKRDPNTRAQLREDHYAQQSIPSLETSRVSVTSSRIPNELCQRRRTGMRNGERGLLRISIECCTDSMAVS